MTGSVIQITSSWISCRVECWIGFPLPCSCLVIKVSALTRKFSSRVQSKEFSRVNVPQSPLITDVTGYGPLNALVLCLMTEMRGCLDRASNPTEPLTKALEPWSPGALNGFSKKVYRTGFSKDPRPPSVAKGLPYIQTVCLTGSQNPHVLLPSRRLKQDGACADRGIKGTASLPG